MLAIGCDHGGYALKEEVKKHLDERGVEYIDCGCNGESVDYPVIASETCAHITSGECEMGPVSYTHLRPLHRHQEKRRAGGAGGPAGHPGAGQVRRHDRHREKPAGGSDRPAGGGDGGCPGQTDPRPQGEEDAPGGGGAGQIHLEMCIRDSFPLLTPLISATL